MKCEICGREFLSTMSLSLHITRGHKIQIKEYYDKYLLKKGEGRCLGLNCKNKTIFDGLWGGYRKFCSSKCMSNDAKIKELKKHTSQKCYGTNYPIQSEKVKIKSRCTSRNNCGEDHFMKTKEGIEKVRQGFFNHFGIDNIFEDIDYIKKCTLNKIGVDNYSKTSEFREFARLQMKEKLESTFSDGQKMKCKEGKNERSIGDELLSYTDEVFLRDQWIGGLQPDLIGKFVLAIVEIDEAYHFSSKHYIDHDRVKNEYYISKGYIPIHIKESDWFEDKELQIIKFQESIRFLKQVQDLNK